MQRLNIVYVTYGIDSFLHRTFPLAERAKAAGHRFVIVSANRRAVAYSGERGIEAVHLAGQEALEESRPRPPRWPTPIGRVLQKLPGLEFGPRGAAAAYAETRRDILLAVDELLETVASLEPDIILTEAEMHRDIRARSSAGYRMMIMDDFYGSRKGGGVPPPSSSFVPGNRIVARLVGTTSWAWFETKRRIRRQAAKWWLRGIDEASVLAELGLPASSRGVFQFYHYDPIPVARRLPPQLMLPGESDHGFPCGPILDLERADALVDPSFGERWPAIRDRCSAADGPTLIVVSPGTLQSGSELTAATVEGLGGVDNLQVIIATPAQEPPAGGLPPNVHWFGRVPMPKVLDCASLAVGTGGTAFMHEALWFGVPLLFLNGGALDQPGNIARAIHHGVGLGLDARKLSGQKISAEVNRVLNDPSYTRSANALAEQFRANDGVSVLLAHIERAAGSGRNS